MPRCKQRHDGERGGACSTQTHTLSLSFFCFFRQLYPFPLNYDPFFFYFTCHVNCKTYNWNIHALAKQKPAKGSLLFSFCTEYRACSRIRQPYPLFHSPLPQVPCSKTPRRDFFLIHLLQGHRGCGTRLRIPRRARPGSMVPWAIPQTKVPMLSLIFIIPRTRQGC